MKQEKAVVSYLGQCHHIQFNTPPLTQCYALIVSVSDVTCSPLIQAEL